MSYPLVPMENDYKSTRSIVALLHKLLKLTSKFFLLKRFFTHYETVHLEINLRFLKVQLNWIQLFKSRTFILIMHNSKVALIDLHSHQLTHILMSKFTVRKYPNAEKL